MRSNIRQLRKQRNISQKMLGEEIGLSQQVVSRMERDRSKIQVDVLINLARYFHVSTDCVLGYCADGEAEDSVEMMLKMQNITSEDIIAEIENLERMDRTRKQAVWQLLAVLKRYL